MIYGDRIRLVAIEKQDLPLFVEWLNDPEVRRGIALYLPMSMAQEERWFEKMLDRPLDEQPLNIEAREGDGWVKIGNMGYFDFDHHARSVEVGIMLGNKDYWNQGYGTEAMTMLLKHGFEILNLNRIMLRVYGDNPRAVRCYEKAGFTHEGCMRQARYWNGEYKDMLIMGILKEEWDQMQDQKRKKETDE